jgi:simple sugar transport system ATP-binding protein
MRRNAVRLIDGYGVRTTGPDQPIGDLSGGNVQRSVLARELDEALDILVVANPCFGLDFHAVADIRGRLLAARNAGAAVLLLSEDLDEILELSDRIAVLSGGRLVHETTPATADLTAIGEAMAGH